MLGGIKWCNNSGEAMNFVSVVTIFKEVDTRRKLRESIYSIYT